jgi:uridine phosphorylase
MFSASVLEKKAKSDKKKQMNTPTYKESELILTPEGSVYHLNLRAEHIAENVILVGDPGRVSLISKHFDTIEFERKNREFITHTGYYRNKRITVLATGIGTDNIDIAINELDAAININPDTRTNNPELKQLNLIRIGTSGALQEDIPVGSFVISEYGLGFDGLLHYYHYEADQLTQDLNEQIKTHLNLNSLQASPYLVKGSAKLLNLLGDGMIKGITATACGFYGPQGRQLRLPIKNVDVNDRLNSFSYKGNRITNFEMETSALYGLGQLMGHSCCTVCVIVANRMRKAYAADHHSPMENLIKHVLDKITA